jgi:hypothetical protein
MTWLLPAEVVSLEVRAPANAVSTASNWIINFMVVMITPVSFTNIGYKTYSQFLRFPILCPSDWSANDGFSVIFAVLNAAMVPIVYCKLVFPVHTLSDLIRISSYTVFYPYVFTWYPPHRVVTE